MNILIVGKTGEEKEFRLYKAAEKRGHKLTVCHSGDLVIKTDADGFTPLIKGEIPLDKFDVIYFWSLGYKRWEWFVAGVYLTKEFGTKIIDYVKLLSASNYTPTPTLSYLVQSKHKIPFPRTVLLFSIEYVDSALKDMSFPLIVKDSIIHQGKGITLAKNKDDVLNFMKERKRGAPILIREFIPNDGDIRVFVIDYKAIGAMKRTPHEGDFRSNISIGGTGSIFDLDKHPEVRELAEKLASLMNIQIAGVDVMLNTETGKPFILEINDEPGFKGFETYTDVDVSSKIIEYFEELHARK